MNRAKSKLPCRVWENSLWTTASFACAREHAMHHALISTRARSTKTRAVRATESTHANNANASRYANSTIGTVNMSTVFNASHTRATRGMHLKPIHEAVVGTTTE